MRGAFAAIAVAAVLLCLGETASAQAPPPCSAATAPAVVFVGLPEQVTPAREEVFGLDDNFDSENSVPGPIAVEFTDRFGGRFFRGTIAPEERGSNLLIVWLDRGDRSISISASYTEVDGNGFECTRRLLRNVREGPPMRLVIRAKGSGVQAMGSFRISTPTLRAAVRAFGEPRSVRSRFGGNGCRVSWPLIGLVITFANFGGYDACDPEYGYAQGAAIRGKAGRVWRTRAGLRIGQSARQIRRRHRSAVRRSGRTWWLVTGRNPYGPSCGGRRCPIGVVTARTSGGRVQSFLLRIGAAGD